MSVNYSQTCIIGVAIPTERLRHVLVPAKYDNQPRYDTKTGAVTHYEKVLIQREEYIYRLFSKDYEYLYEIEEGMRSKFDLDTGFNSEETMIYIGKSVGKSEDLGRVDLLSGEISFEELNTIKDEVSSKIPDYEIKIHFIPYCG